MITHNNIKNIAKEAESCVLLIGNFDGVHLGHRAIIEKARAIAKSSNSPLGVMTFNPHPRSFFASGGVENFCLNSSLSKNKILAKMGIDHLFVIDFDKEFSNISAQDFISKVLKEKLNVSHIVVGKNFTFGRNREGNIDMLKEAGNKNSFDLTVFPIKKIDTDKEYSSTVIRELLSRGEFDKAEQLLGRRWYIESPVVHGDKRGRELGFPTANQELGDYIKIPYGVYAVKVLIEGENIYRDGVANFGVRPMFEVETPIFETFIFNFDDDLYDKNILVVPIKYLRGEVKFKDIKTLVSRIKDDCINAKNLLEICNV